MKIDVAARTVQQLTLPGRFRVIALALLFGVVVSPFCPVALADTSYTVDSGWKKFTFPNPAFAPSFNTEGAFTFTLVGPARLRVTDVDCRGEIFQINDIGTLPAPGGSGLAIGTVVGLGPCPDVTGTSDPDIAFADKTYSHLELVLGPGNHSLTFQVLQGYFFNQTTDGGIPDTGFFRVDTVPPVPTLSTWGFLLLALLLAAASVRALRYR